MAKRLTCLPLLLLVVTLAGCSTAGQEGAATGAKAGAVGGLVAGAVGSIFWGGDAVNNALRSAAVGAASGAAVGAVAAEDRSKKAGTQGGSASPPPPGAPPGQDAQALKAWVGPGNYAAGEELARCRHMGALSKAEQAFARETDPERKGIALLIQAMAAEESGNTTKADEVYRHWAQFDPTRSSRDKARADALAGILKIQQIRKDNGLPVLCT